MNNNGLSDFYVFSVEENRQEMKQDTLEAINKRLENIENKLGGINVQSVSNDAESKSVSIGTDEKSEPKKKKKSSGNDKR